jgi:hypothetical protein
MQIEQDLRDPAHADPADADEMNPLRLGEQFLIPNF